MVKTRNVVSQSAASLIKADLEILFRLIETENIKTILEIGTWRGYSAKAFADVLHPEMLITIDHDIMPIEAVIIPENNYYYLWEHDSNDEITLNKVKECLAGRKVDFMFIDGGHQFHIVEKDWNMYKPLMAEHGIIAFHDVTVLQTNETVKALWEWVLKPNFNYVEIKTDRNSTGVGVIFL